MRKFVIMLSAIISLSSNARAEDSTTIAMALGSVIAAEEPCGFTYNQAAIQLWITKHVRDSDMDFSSNLYSMVDGVGYEIQQMSVSGRTAFCVQSARVARVNGFIQ